MIDRLHRFRQAILDAHEKHGIEYEHDLGPNEFPSGPLSVKASFGTPDQPMLIPSFAESRLVGCQGTIKYLAHFSTASWPSSVFFPCRHGGLLLAITLVNTFPDTIIDLRVVSSPHFLTFCSCVVCLCVTCFVRFNRWCWSSSPRDSVAQCEEEQAVVLP